MAGVGSVVVMAAWVAMGSPAAGSPDPVKTVVGTPPRVEAVTPPPPGEDRAAAAFAKGLSSMGK